MSTPLSLSDDSTQRLDRIGLTLSGFGKWDISVGSEGEDNSSCLPHDDADVPKASDGLLSRLTEFDVGPASDTKLYLRALCELREVGREDFR